MSAGLKLDQFKEPALSSKIFNIKSKMVYIDSVYNMNNIKNFKFLFPLKSHVKKNEAIALKSINNSKYKSVKIYSHENYIVKEVKYLINERDNASTFIVLELDENITKYDDEKIDYSDEKFNNISLTNKSVEQLIDLSYNAGIIDETDGIYLFEKFQLFNGVSENYKIYIDAIDDQPYTSSKESILLHYPQAINFIVKCLKQILKTVDIDIIYYDYEKYNKRMKINKKCFETNVIGLKGNYPIRHYINKKLHYDGYIGIQAMLHLARTLLYNDYKQTTTFITVSGDDILKSRNIEVPIGTSTKDIIENFDLKSEPKKIILGQVMTGIAISDIITPISATTRSILAFRDYIVFKQMECIGCSKCADVCPQNLLPSYRNKFIETGDFNYKYFSSDEKCIKCYCCSYICPSHINLV